MLSLNNIIRKDTPESMTRLIAFLMALSLIGWQWYAVIHKSTVPNITEILFFIAAAMGWKQYQERKEREIPNGTTPQP
jgi:hypothetical protein